MQYWIISANGKMYDHAAAFAEFGFIDWVQSANFAVGDIVYIYCTKPTKRLMYKTLVNKVGMCFDDIQNDAKFWKDPLKYAAGKTRRFARLELIEKVDSPELSLDKLLKHGLSSAPQRPVRILKQNLIDYIDTYLKDALPSHSLGEEEFPTDYYEGAVTTVLMNKYERSSIARMKCIEHHGCKCMVCDIDFEKVYGVIGKDFIHVHHIVPISTIGKEYKIDYENDLIPICPNCHAMLHRKKDGKSLTVEELKELIRPLTLISSF